MHFSFILEIRFWMERPCPADGSRLTCTPLRMAAAMNRRHHQQDRLLSGYGAGLMWAAETKQQGEVDTAPAVLSLCDSNVRGVKPSLVS